MDNPQLSHDFIAGIKARVRQAQYEALKAVNTQLIALYWEIGQGLAQKQKDGWGRSIVATLSAELQKEFPGVGGFSATNLSLMVQFYNEYSEAPNLQPLVGAISWSKHLVILQRCKDALERQFYIQATKEFGWTKAVLSHNIAAQTYEKFLLNQTNFDETLPPAIRHQAQLAVKDEYTFEFLGLGPQHAERELEEALIQNIRAFLLELGPHYSFIGNQYRVQAGAREYAIDLLLFHRRLQCLIAIDLKIGEFEPEHKGKMEFYLTVLNDTVRLPHEHPAIGIIICKEKDRTVVEYSLSSSAMPIGVATYHTGPALPKPYDHLLPAREDIAARVAAYFTAANNPQGSDAF